MISITSQTIRKSFCPRATACRLPLSVFYLLTSCLGLLSLPGSAMASSTTRWVVDETGRAVELPLHPQRIVSIAPSVTEILFALGLENKVVGRSDYCDYPPQAKLKPSVGGLINPSLETIVSLHPDLVIGTPEINKISIAEQLSKFHVPVYGVHTQSLGDVLRTLTDVGRITDSDARAHTLVQSLQQRREAVVRRVAALPRPRVLFLIWYSPVSVPGRSSFLTDLISLAGGQSISADLRQDWAQMSLEEIVHRDPEIILVPSSNESSPPIEKLRTWPGWNATTAARTNRIIAVDDRSSRPGPRLFDALEEFARIFHPENK